MVRNKAEAISCDSADARQEPEAHQQRCKAISKFGDGVCTCSTNDKIYSIHRQSQIQV